jgi:hypothetical protein
MHRSTLFLSMTLATGLGTTNFIAVAQTAAPDHSWVDRSNQYTQMLLDVQLAHSPETGSAQGRVKFDTLITDGSRADEIAQRKELEKVLAQLKEIEAKEKDRNVREDLEILQRAFNLQFREDDYQLDHKVPFIDPSRAVYAGLHVLLEDHVVEQRRPAALVRLRKYAGVEPGFKPITDVLKQRLMEQMAKPGVVFPASDQVEDELEREKSYMDAISALFRKYQMKGWEDAYGKLNEEIAEYDTWVRSTLMPKTSKSDQPTPAEYALALESYGVAATPDQLAGQAHTAFAECQTEMAPLAAEVAKAHGWSLNDYRNVLHELKKAQVAGDAIVPLYQDRLKAIDEAIVAKKLITLPDTKVRMRVATAEETTQSPSPRMEAPQFLHPSGEEGDLVLPLNTPSSAAVPSLTGAPSTTSGAYGQFDDFTYDAVSWPETAQEVRPGHELQFDAMLKRGMSLARALYGFKSANMEGWGLYSEWLMQPYEPAEGQLATLQLRMLDAARGFLDPELESGKITPSDAYRLLVQDVVLSPAYAAEEVDRFTQRLPGQATSFFYSYTKMMQLRKETEAALGAKFDPKRFNDFVVAQGMLPPDLLRSAVMEEFVPAQKR